MAALFVGAFITVGYISTLTVGRMVEERYEIKATNLNRVLSRMGYPVNDDMMKKIRSVINADIAVVTNKKKVIYSNYADYHKEKLIENSFAQITFMKTLKKKRY